MSLPLKAYRELSLVLTRKENQETKSKPWHRNEIGIVSGVNLRKCFQNYLSLTTEEVYKIVKPDINKETILDNMNNINKCTAAIKKGEGWSRDIKDLKKVVATAIHLYHKFRTTVTRPLPTRVISQNVTGINQILQPQGDIPDTKDLQDRKRTADAVLKAAAKHIYIVQEHKIREGDFVQFRRTHPQFAIGGAPAIPAKDGRPKWGAAIIWSRFKYGEPVIEEVLEPGICGYITFNKNESFTTYVSIYLPPHHALAGLSRPSATRAMINKWLEKLPQQGDMFLGGDFNIASGEARQTDFAAMLDEIMADKGLVRATSEIKDTFIDNENKSVTDAVYVRSSLLNYSSRAIIKASRTYNDYQKAQHARIKVAVTAVQYPDVNKYPEVRKNGLKKVHQNDDAGKALRKDIENISGAFEPSVWMAKLAGVNAKHIAMRDKRVVKDEHGRPVKSFKTLRGVLRTKHLLNITVHKEQLEEIIEHLGRIGSHYQREYVVNNTTQFLTTGMPREALIDVFRIIDYDFSRKKAMQYTLGIGRGGETAVVKEKARYKRLRDLKVKHEGELAALFKEDQRLTKTIAELEAEVRRNRPFWHEEPEALPEDFESILSSYATRSTPAPALPIPDVHRCRERILHSPDTGVGTDNVTYATLRCASKEVAQVAAWTMHYWSINGFEEGNYPPQLLVWIPKAIEGLSNENWRPLNLPTTFLRIISGIVTDYLSECWAEALHPAQAMASHFREAHANYRKAQNGMEGDLINFSAVYVTDLVKAFELVKPEWIIRILQARKAPKWLIQVARFFTRTRKAIPKILNRMLCPIEIKVGIDMGNALAPWLFCIAIDPIIRHLNEIPGALTHAYMDDTTTNIRDIRTLTAVQNTWAMYENTGIGMAKHHCIAINFQAGKTNVPHFCEADQIMKEGQIVKEANQQATPGEVIAKCMESECKCKPTIKTCLVTNRLLTEEEWCQVNNTPQGPMIVTDKAKDLGLMIHRQAGNGTTTTKQEEISAGCIYEPYLKKMKERHHKAIQSGGAVIDRTRYWIVCARSLLHYPATQKLPSKSICLEVMRYQAQVMKTEGWIDMTKAIQVYNVLGINNAMTIEQACKQAFITAAVREYGIMVIKGGDNTKGKSKEAADLLRQHFQDSPEKADLWRTLTQAQGSNNQVACEVKKYYKIAARIDNIRQGKDYLYKQLRIWGWTQSDVDQWTNTLSKIPTKVLSENIRIQALKFLLKHKIRDLHVEAKITAKEKNEEFTTCKTCIRQDTMDDPTRCKGQLIYPYGIYGKPVCQNHWNKWKEDINYDFEQSSQEEREGFPQWECLLCKSGQATWTHYSTLCPAINKVWDSLGLSKGIHTLVKELEPNKVATAMIIIAELYFSVVAKGGFKPEIDGPPLRTIRQATAYIAKKVLTNLPPQLLTGAKMNALQQMTTNLEKTNKCHVSHTKYVTIVRQQGRENIMRPSEPIVVCAEDIDPNTELGSYTSGCLQALINTDGTCFPMPQASQRPNCKYKTRKCTCGEKIWQLHAICKIRRGETLRPVTSPMNTVHPKTLIIRFDGSCKSPGTSNPRSGAGVAIFITDEKGHMELIAQYAWPLPQAKDAAQAEAFGSRLAIQIMDEYENYCRTMDKVLIQGDNFNTIGFWNGLVRLHSSAAIDIYEQEIDGITPVCDNNKIELEHIYRAFNKEADAAANIGAELVKNYCKTEKPTFRTVVRISKDKPLSENLPTNHYITSVCRAVNDEDEMQKHIALPENISLNPELSKKLPKKYAEHLRMFIKEHPGYGAYSTNAAHKGRGRFYSTGHGVAATWKCRKAMRYLLLANEHYGIDIRNCHYTITIMQLHEDPEQRKNMHEALESGVKAVEWITNRLLAQKIQEQGIPISDEQIRDVFTKEAKTHAKKILQVLPNVEPGQARNVIRSKIGFFVEDPTLNRFIYRYSNQWLPEIKKGLHQIMGQNIPVWQACQNIEADVMLRTIGDILHTGIKSIIWLHDGIYLDNNFPYQKVHELINIHAQRYGCNFLTRTEDLKEEFHEIVNHELQNGDEPIDEAESFANQVQPSDKEEIYELELAFRDLPKIMRK